jgi:hypothetical protein
VGEGGVLIVGSRCVAMPSDDDDDDDLVRATVNCKLCELVKRLQLLLKSSCKSSINPVTTPNPMFSH